MNKSTLVVAGLLAACLLLMPACDWFKKVPMIEEPSFRILDINTLKVYEDAHIPGATHVSLLDLEEVATDWDRKTPIVTYCSDYNCMASHKAAQMLSELGFLQVSVYAGGISEWYKLSKESKEQYPVEGPAQLAFLEKDVERLAPDEEESNVVSAEEVAKLLQS